MFIGNVELGPKQEHVMSRFTVVCTAVRRKKGPAMFRLCCLIAVGALVSGCATPARNDARTYKTDLDKCAADYAAQKAQCERLYGPSPENGGDPEAFGKCIEEANTDHTNCIKSAVHKYNSAVARPRSN